MREVAASLFLAMLAGCGLVLDLDPDAPVPAADAGLVDAHPGDGSTAIDGATPVDAAPADAGLDAAPVPPETCGGLSCFQDDFPEADRNPVWREYVYPPEITGGSAVQAGGVVTITPGTGVEYGGHGYVSWYAYDARSDRASVQVTRVADAPAQTYFGLRYDDEAALMIHHHGTMILVHIVGETPVVRHDVAFMVADQPWWQVRGEGGRLYFEAAADGSDFVTLFDIAAPHWLGAAHIELGVNVQTETTEPMSADFDELNLDPGRVRTPNCPAGAPMDGFEDAAIDPYLWATSSELGLEGCTVTEGSGVMTLSGVSTMDDPCGAFTRHAYDLSSGVFVQRAAGFAARSLVFGILDAAERHAILGCYDGLLHYSMPEGGITSSGPCPEEPYWRLALVGDQIELSVAETVGSWRTVASAPRGMLDTTAVRPFFVLEPSEVPGAAMSVSVESFNLP